MARNEDVTQVRARRQRLGFKIKELALEAGIKSPDTLSDLEAGHTRPHPETVSKVLAALDRLEAEVGFDAPPLPPGVVAVGDPADDLFAVEVYTPEGVVVMILKGPVKNADVIVEAGLKAAARLRARTLPEDDGA